MEIGRDWDTTWKNQWPSESQVPGFKQNMLDFYEVSCLFSRYPYKLTMPERLAMYSTSMSCVPLQLASILASISLMKKLMRNVIICDFYPIHRSKQLFCRTMGRHEQEHTAVCHVFFIYQNDFKRPDFRLWDSNTPVPGFRWWFRSSKPSYRRVCAHCSHCES